MSAGVLLVIVNFACFQQITEILARLAEAFEPGHVSQLVQAYETYCAHVGFLLIALGIATILLPRLIAAVTARLGRGRPPDGDSILVVCIVVNLFSILFVVNAYVCDDAFITFRTIDNFLQGHGLRWNTIERVQTFTNPLWLFVVSLFYAPFRLVGDLNDLGKLYIIALSLSYLFSLSALLLLCLHLVKNRVMPIAIGALLVLVSSKAFVDFTSSGLEFPLNYFLITLFYLHLYDRWDRPSPGAAAISFLVAALAFVNRQSTIVLTVIPCIALFLRTAKADSLRGAIRAGVLGWLPACAWVVFAVVYYGFPFPNTYYAKLELGIPVTLLKQGINHLFLVSRTDPITILAIILAIPLTFLRRSRLSLIGTSLLLHLLYVINTGGDFMGGRYFSTAYLVSVIGLSLLFAKETVGRSRFLWPVFFFGLVLYNLLAPLSPVKGPFHVLIERSTQDRGEPLFELSDSLQEINMEKSFYYMASNPLFYRKGGFPFGIFPFHILRDLEHCNELRNEEITALVGDGGVYGFCRGPGRHLVTSVAITDPLIARLPVPDLSRGFVPGHFKRPIPAGHVESYIAGENLIADPGLHAFNEKLRTITQGPLFTKKRWQAIWALNFPERRYNQTYD